MSGKSKKTYRLTFNAPVILSFALICVGAYILNTVTAGKSNALVFSVYRSSLRDILTYVRFVGHIFGHASLDHLVNNMMMVLLLGPAIEAKYGHREIIFVMVITAVLTGIVNFIFFRNIALLGASGVIFAFIMMNAATSFKDHEIPITFILVAALYLGEQIAAAFTVQDNVSQLTHIIGGIIGGIYALAYVKRK